VLPWSTEECQLQHNLQYTASRCLCIALWSPWISFPLLVLRTYQLVASSFANVMSNACSIIVSFIPVITCIQVNNPSPTEPYCVPSQILPTLLLLWILCPYRLIEVYVRMYVWLHKQVCILTGVLAWLLMLPWIYDVHSASSRCIKQRALARFSLCTFSQWCKRSTTV